MSKTKIKRDKHGLYVRGGGYLMRPDYPVGYSHAHGPTEMLEGDVVRVRHSGGPLASVRNDRCREYWYIHGTYLRGDRMLKGHIPSEEVYRPDHTNWEI